MLALSTCWNSQRHTDGRALALEARELGFEWIEVSHGTQTPLLPGLLAAVAAREIRVTSLHNFCPPPVEVRIDAPDVYEFSSSRHTERQRALALTARTIEMAARLEAPRVVVHLGSVSMKTITHRLESMAQAGHLYSREYCDLKLRFVAQRQKAAAVCLQRAMDALEQLLPVCAAHQVQLGVETRSHYEQIPSEAEMRMLLEHFKGSRWLGAWHDFGHVQRQVNLGLTDHAQYLGAIAPRLIGCHVHDVRWPAKDHRVPLTAGGVDYARLLPLLPADIPLVWELHPGQRPDEIRAALPRWRELSGAQVRP